MSPLFIVVDKENEIIVINKSNLTPHKLNGTDCIKEADCERLMVSLGA
jgi:hypothetical protein